MTLPDFLRSDEYGEVFLTGHRITLYHIIKDYRQGASVNALAATFPTVAVPLLDNVVAFYLANRSDIEQYMDRTHAEIERQAAAPARGPSLADLERRLEIHRHSETA